jgi:hypothetical protein
MAKQITNTLGIEVGDVITFTNRRNFLVTIKVSRVERVSWYGTTTGGLNENRSSYGTLESYKRESPDFKITKPTPGNPEFTTHKVMYKGQEVEAINFGKL